ncbi:Rv1355c family protein [Saccharomonospora cyanea]|uniref:Dinucleotide-utilizing enzyme possibly involved in molybdopterin or thiamin biosynthesis n=1 Tax=Saccharomonospora cyanea NA-134 TaxID=882082 RepID=H5XCT4_9PSEU|nr:Rv1355c family protein [Saccharomonospora cyanea]EHR62328.1 dinucleotide-utilizing enzyme possibly involved in molybdopterin or thiamin biosynthesis [Saccharomonospora cyanea NA-134]
MTVHFDETCSATVLDERDPRDAAEVERLRAVPGTEVRDLCPDQSAELRAVAGDHAVDETEGSRWVHYPWRATLVRILGPTAYRELRLSRNRNKITPAEQEAHATRTVAVAGAGAGHAVALGLVLEGLVGALRIADREPVGTTDLNQLPGSLVDAGLNRTVALARRIAELDPYLTVSTRPEGLDVAEVREFVEGADLVIDAADELAVRLALREQARALRVPVLAATPDRGTVDVERFDLDPERPPFHGLLAGFTADMFAGLPAAAAVPFLPRILGGEGISSRMAASLFLIGESLPAWPQLGGDVLQAAAGIVAAVRRIDELPSGRAHLDVAARLDELAEPQVPQDLPPFEPVGRWRNLADPASDVETIVRAGQLAPSAGNCQPWRIAARNGAVRVELDEKYTSAIDVGFRASYVAIGAAVQNMRIAAAARAVLGDVELFPDDSAVAVLSLGDGRTKRLADAYEPMLRRVTNRQAVDPDRAVPDEVLATLTAEAREHGGELAVVTGGQAATTAGEIIASADRVRYLVPDLHREMVSEMRDPRVESVERGLDVRSLELGVGAPVLDLVRRADVMAELAGTDDPATRGLQGRALVASYPALVAVLTPGGEPIDYVRGGQAVESVWIAATAAGLSARPAVPLFLYARHDAELASLGGRYADELAVMRRDLYTALGVPEGREIALLLLLGYAPEPSAISLRSPETAVTG